MPDSVSGTQSAGSYRKSSWPDKQPGPDPVRVAPTATSVAKPKPKLRAKPKAKVVAPARSRVVVEVTPDGERAIERTATKDGETVVERDATLEEQLEALAGEIGLQVVRMVNQARDGDVSVAGRSITVKLRSL